MSETEIKLFQPLKEFWNNFKKSISAMLNMLENIHELQLASEIILEYLYLTCNHGIITVVLMWLCRERLLMMMADVMAADGYLEAGYQYVTVDDCWLANTRDKDGRLQPDPTRFPRGMKHLADYVSIRPTPLYANS